MEEFLFTQYPNMKYIWQRVITWWTLADILRRARRLDTQSSILAVVVLTDSSEVVLDGSWDRRDLTEPPGVPPWTHAPVAANPILARRPVLTDVRRTVVHVVGTVLARVAARTVASTQLHSAVGLSLLWARRSGTDYRLSFVTCLLAVMFLGALQRRRRHYSCYISASSAIDVRMILRYTNFRYLSIYQSVSKMKSSFSAVTFDTFFTVDSRQRTRGHSLENYQTPK